MRTLLLISVADIIGLSFAVLVFLAMGLFALYLAYENWRTERRNRNKK
jgi:di/tricarboxylate transporter